MAAPDAAIDRRVLHASIVASAAIGTLGVAWGISTGSQMIVLDGAYAVVGIALSLLLLRATTVAAIDPSNRFPYGLRAATPLAVGTQGFALLATLLYATYDALMTIRDGGSEVSAGWAVLYGVIVTVFSVTFAMWVRRSVGGSDVIAAESAAWQIAAWTGVGMVLGFGLLAVAQHQSWDSITPWIDPGMVIVTSVALIGSPIGMIRTMFAELLEAAPIPALREPVEQSIADTMQSHGVARYESAVTKLGHRLYVDVTGWSDASSTIAYQENIRVELREALDAMPLDIWLNFDLRPDPERR